jgi:hypothetical protein
MTDQAASKRQRLAEERARLDALPDGGYTTDALRLTFQRGYAAFEDGLARGANPYEGSRPYGLRKPGGYIKAWFGGWDAGSKAAIETQQLPSSVSQSNLQRGLEG